MASGSDRNWVKLLKGSVVYLYAGQVFSHDKYHLCNCDRATGFTITATGIILSCAHFIKEQPRTHDSLSSSTCMVDEVLLPGDSMNIYKKFWWFCCQEWILIQFCLCPAMVAARFLQYWIFFPILQFVHSGFLEVRFNSQRIPLQPMLHRYSKFGGVILIRNGLSERGEVHFRLNIFHYFVQIYGNWKMKEGVIHPLMVSPRKKTLNSTRGVDDSAFCAVVLTDFVVWQEDAMLGYATPLLIDRDMDVALFKLQESSLLSSYIPFVDSANMEELSDIYVIGYPGSDNQHVVVSHGILSTKKFKIPWRDSTRFVYRADVAVNPGNSGSPIVHDGGFVGIQIGQTKTYCDSVPCFEQHGCIFIPSQVLKDFIRGNMAKIREIPDIGSAAAETLLSVIGN